MSGDYSGEPSLGNGRSSGSSSRKGKKSPKQPQRGLGVAQLEKIRLQSQMVTSLHSPRHTNLNQAEDTRMQTTSYGCHYPNIMMGFGEMKTTEIRYADSQSSTTARWNHSHVVLEMQPNATGHSLGLHMEDSLLHKKRRKDRRDSMGSSSQNSESSDTQEVDLELKLSL